MAPQLTVFSRDAGSSQSPLTPITIVGIVIACLLAVGLSTWLGIHFYRKRLSRAREEERTAAFLSIKGIVRESEETEKDLPSSDSLGHTGNFFSRSQLANGVVMPHKAILRPNASRDEIIQHYTEEGSLPRPFAPFMGDGGLAPPPPIGGESSRRSSSSSFLSLARNSFLAAPNRASHRFSVASFATTASSGTVNSGAQGVRKIRQIFNPVLPDELVISAGERVTIVSSFDDGWCIVGRDGFGGVVELGAVPAWCFVKPSPGLRAERPLRTSSLGVTVNMEDSDDRNRNDVISWSNF